MAIVVLNSELHFQNGYQAYDCVVEERFGFLIVLFTTTNCKLSIMGLKMAIFN